MKAVLQDPIGCTRYSIIVCIAYISIGLIFCIVTNVTLSKAGNHKLTTGNNNIVHIHLSVASYHRYYTDISIPGLLYLLKSDSVRLEFNSW